MQTTDLHEEDECVELKDARLRRCPNAASPKSRFTESKRPFMLGLSTKTLFDEYA